MTTGGRGESDDYLGIRRLQSAYADSVTRGAWHELSELFRPGATLTVGSGEGAAGCVTTSSPVCGVGGMQPPTIITPSSIPTTNLFIGFPRVAFQDGPGAARRTSR